MINVNYHRTPIARHAKRVIPVSIKNFLISLLKRRSIIGLIRWRNYTLKGVYYDFKSVPDHVVVEIFLGVWESAEVYMAKKYLSDELTIIECGSSLGVLASSLLARSSCANYIAIEANPETFRILTHQMSRYCQVCCINLAVSYPESIVAFSNSSISGGKVVQANCLNDCLTSDTIAVKGKPLSLIIKECSELSAHNFSLILDIEGMEALIFKHDSEFIKKARYIICELENTPDASISDQIATLNSLGFKVIERYDNVIAFRSEINA